MKSVNLIYYNNGVGLAKDAEILNKILSESFVVENFDAFGNDCPPADINIFLQNVDVHTKDFISKATTNILIPNLEWMFEDSVEYLKRINFVFAKSKECKQVLSSYHKLVTYTGFTSIDRFVTEIPKTKRFLHFAGKSIQKYTELIVDVFSELQIPITIVDSTERFKGKTPSNIEYISKFLSEEEVNQVFNSHSIHICCSLAEGWGHYIYEAMSCKSLVFVNYSAAHEELPGSVVYKIKTVNYPAVPTLSFQEDSEYPLRKLNYTSRDDLISAIRTVTWLSDKEIRDMGEKSREYYLTMDKTFKDRLLLNMSFLKKD